MHSFLIEKFDWVFIGRKLFITPPPPPLYLNEMLNSVIALWIMLFGTYKIGKSSFGHHICDRQPLKKCVTGKFGIWPYFHLYCVQLKKRPALKDNMENIIFYQDNAPCHISQEKQIELDLINFRDFRTPLNFAAVCSVSLFEVTGSKTSTNSARNLYECWVHWLRTILKTFMINGLPGTESASGHTENTLKSIFKNLITSWRLWRRAPGLYR
jgi:hypothetical protein